MYVFFLCQITTHKTKIMELIERIKEKKWRDYIEMEEY